jgi:hypothetical protein
VSSYIPIVFTSLHSASTILYTHTQFIPVVFSYIFATGKIKKTFIFFLNNNRVNLEIIDDVINQ